MSLIYCYGVVEGSPSVEAKGFESREVYPIQFKDISAVVSNVSAAFSQESIDKNVKDMGWLADNAPIHEAVVDKVMAMTTIIPMKFCTIFTSKKRVQGMLEERYADLRYNLQNLKGRVEMGVKVYFDTTELDQKLREEDPEIRKMEKEAKKKKPGAAYFDKQKIDILLKARVRSMMAKEAKSIFDEVRALAEESRQNEPLDRKITGRDMLLNAVFLIQRDGVEEFKAGVDGLKESHDMQFEVWGPFPPYNFIK